MTRLCRSAFLSTTLLPPRRRDCGLPCATGRSYRWRHVATSATDFLFYNYRSIHTSTIASTKPSIQSDAQYQTTNMLPVNFVAVLLFAAATFATPGSSSGKPHKERPTRGRLTLYVKSSPLTKPTKPARRTSNVSPDAQTRSPG